MSTPLSESSRAGSSGRSPLTICEIELRLDIQGRLTSLSIDPGYFNPLFFTKQIADVYETGLGKKLPLQDMSLAQLLAAHGVGCQTSADVPPDKPGMGTGGVTGHIIMQTEAGDWLRIADQTYCDLAVVYYQVMRPSRTYYRVALPVTPSGVEVDVVFWSSKHRDIYREGMPAFGFNMTDPHYADAVGRLEKPLDNGQITHARYVPTPGRKPKFNSTADELCYHFENCSWSCMVE